MGIPKKNFRGDAFNPLEATGSPGTHEKNDFLDTLIIDFTFWALAP